MQPKNLWAPWRIEYIKGLSEKSECFICDAIACPEKDTDHFVLWRTKSCMVIFNRFPYNNGHMLICPVRHIADLSDATDQELLELMQVPETAKKFSPKRYFLMDLILE